MEYLFSALDLAFFTLIYESELPEVVCDPLGRISEKKVEQLRQEFFARWQSAGLLTVKDDTVTLSRDLAKALTPVYNATVSIMRPTQAVIAKAEFDQIVYRSEGNGVTLIKQESSLYRLTWYPDVQHCQADFMLCFGLDKIGPFEGEAFCFCADAAQMDRFMGMCKGKHSREDEQRLQAFAEEMSLSPERMKEIMQVLQRDRDSIVLQIARREASKLGGIMVKLARNEAYMMKFIASPDGDLISFESVSNSGIWDQIIDFKGR